MSNLYSNSIFWIDTEKIKPNPYQPRKDFDEERLRDLADSIKQYGVLQPLTVSRIEVQKEDGGLAVEYELIAGERRLRASKIAGISQVPVIIRVGDSSMAKLELAILENLQREDLNVVDRARAFFRLSNEFKFTHNEIAKKLGRSREYVSNSLRILALPEDILAGVSGGKITEGHTRPLLMLADHPEEQLTLYKEIVYRKITVREAEKISRKIATDRVRKKEYMPDPEISELEEEFQEKLGTRVHIDRKELGGQIKIDFFSTDDLRTILEMINKSESEKKTHDMLDKYISKNEENKVHDEQGENKSIDGITEEENKVNENTEIVFIARNEPRLHSEQEPEFEQEPEPESILENQFKRESQPEEMIKSEHKRESNEELELEKENKIEKDDKNNDSALYDISRFSL